MRKGKQKTMKIGVHEGLRQIRTDAAGIDVGASEIWVDVGAENSVEPVQPFPDIHGRFEPDGGVAEKLWHPHSGDGIDRRLLDSGVSNPGRSRDRGRVCECGPREECKQPQKRRAGLPVAADAALLWIAGGFIPASQRYWNFAQLDEASADAD